MPSDSVSVTITNTTLKGKMDNQPILPVTVPVKKIKGATHQCYGGGDRVVQCEQTLNKEVVCAHHTGGQIQGQQPTVSAPINRHSNVCMFLHNYDSHIVGVFTN